MRRLLIALAIVMVAAVTVTPSAANAQIEEEAHSGGDTIAFIAGNSTPPSGDRGFVAHLENQGYQVMIIDDDTLAPGVLAGADIAIVSSSVVPSKVPAWLAAANIPLMTSEAYSFEKLGLADKGRETSYSDTSIRIGDASHPLAAGFTGKPTVFASAPGRLNVGSAGDDAIVIGTESSGIRRPVHFGYEAQTMMANGDYAPNRRLATMMIYGGADDLNGVGWQLIDAGIEWLFDAPVPLQILAINDFHGNIATSSGSFGGTGRADFLATNIAAREADAKNSIFVSAGDLIGASPLISALFHDEPTIEAMNLIGLDINAVGNHEFDEGGAELLRMANGGSHPVDGDLDGDPFFGADFEFLAANVVDDASGETIFPGTSIREYDGVNVAFIGMTLEGTPTIVTPAGVAGLTFNDEVETVNALVPQLQADGIEAIVVLLHEGGISNGGPQDCGDGLVGPVADITAALDDAVDLVIAGHTNDEFICEIDGKWVTMADNRGRLFTDIDALLDPATGELTVTRIENVSNLQDGVTPDPIVTALIDKYDTLSAPLANAVIGTITTDITEDNTPAGESALGDVIADAQLAATAPAGFGDAVAAFMNPGGIRADLDFAALGAEADGEVTFGEAFTTQPFGNSLVTMTLTGEQIDTLLEQQWVGQTRPRILQVSEGFAYSWDAAAPDGAKVDIADISIGGVAIDAAADYRVTVNSFLSDGGDNFVVLRDGTDRLGGEVDLDALVRYMGANSPVAPGPQDRITVLNLDPA